MTPVNSPAPAQERPVSNPWALKIASVAGIPIYLHFTFLLLLLFLGLGKLTNLLFVIALFACVALHELGHAMTALRYGIPVSDITLYPIGGIARIEKQPAPAQELWVAIAGPAVNLVIAGGLALYLAGTGQLATYTLVFNENAGWVQKVMTANLYLMLFNLIPAFPMDGGRILRAALAFSMPLERATTIAANIGQTLAILAGLFGILTGWWTLLLIAFFVYLGAGQEVMVVKRDTLVKNVSVQEAMLNEIHTLPQGATYREAADLLLSTSQQDFPVTIGEEVYGLLSRDALLRGLAQEGPDAYIASGMNREFTRADPEDDLLDLLHQMQDGSGPALVFEGERLVGMVTSENLMEFLLIRQITRDQQPETASA
ncbi:MAG: site-2 protease family protein [Armatimonadetes bacterium]|nr:site-2 protease family protein [Armatimonadota bacterium]